MDWKHLTELTRGMPFAIERVRMRATAVAIEGSFELPALAQLPAEDQLFIVAFIRSHGSIKDMEKLFGVSYPTIKARLNRLAELLEPAIAVEQVTSPPAPPGEERRALLDKLERGEITVQQALQELGK
ncbi:MAG TPA: DUF2089 family protein [Polyangiaceae bacterium]|jgi:hypothetical protein|nr:DUF2089 family protein [Polyangiaceae bacterium]